MSLKIKFFADNGNWVLHIQIGLFIGFMEHNAPSTNKSLIFPRKSIWWVYFYYNQNLSVIKKIQ